ncbi:MAG: hypothetical protein WKF63_06365 [Thermomicrobiales bacterium]
MFKAASVVTYSVDPEHADELARRVQDHLVPAAREVAGYQGFLLLDQGDGKRMAILLFDSLESVSAAQEALTPVGRDYTYSLMSGPAIGSLATVLIADGVLDKATNV